MKFKRYAVSSALLAALTAYGQSNLSFTKINLISQFVGEGVSVGDFNKDGKLDVAAGVFLWYGPAFTQRVKYGSGTETFDGAVTYAAYFMNQAAMDINGDGWADIPVFAGVGSGNFWLENPKGGTAAWRRATVLPFTGFESNGLYPLLKNGALQLLTANNARQIGWAVPDAANPSGEWKFHVVGDGGYVSSTHGLGMGDINGDGRNDMLAPDAWFEQPASIVGDPRWVRHDYKFHMDVGGRSGGAQMYADDIDGDGDADVVSSLDGHGWGLAWFEQIKTAAGAITFTPHRIMGERKDEATYGVAFSQLHSLAFADLDGDGRKDIVTGKRYWAHLTDRDPEPMGAAVLYAFLNTRGPSGTTFKPVLIDSSAGSGSRLETTDVNGDGYADVIVSSKKGANVFVSVNRPAVTTLPGPMYAGRLPEVWRLSVRFPGCIPQEGKGLMISGAWNGSFDVRGISRWGAQAAGIHLLKPTFAKPSSAPH